VKIKMNDFVGYIFCYASFMPAITSARRQDLAAGGGKKQKEGPKTRRRPQFKITVAYWMYVATGGQT